MGEQRVVLEDVTAAALLRWPPYAAACVSPYLAPVGDASGVRADRPRKHPQDRRLAGAGRSRQREAAAGWHIEADVQLEGADGMGKLSVKHRRAQRATPASTACPGTSITASRTPAETTTRIPARATPAGKSSPHTTTPPVGT